MQLKFPREIKSNSLVESIPNMKKIQNKLKQEALQMQWLGQTYRLLGFCLLCVLMNYGAFAQTALPQHAVIQLFEKPHKVQWVKHYKGRIDDLNALMLGITAVVNVTVDVRLDVRTLC